MSSEVITLFVLSFTLIHPSLTSFPAQSLPQPEMASSSNYDHPSFSRPSSHHPYHHTHHTQHTSPLHGQTREASQSHPLTSTRPRSRTAPPLHLLPLPRSFTSPPPLTGDGRLSSSFSSSSSHFTSPSSSPSAVALILHPRSFLLRSFTATLLSPLHPSPSRPPLLFSLLLLLPFLRTCIVLLDWPTVFIAACPSSSPLSVAPTWPALCWWNGEGVVD
jgi:hypothetical protein